MHYETMMARCGSVGIYSSCYQPDQQREDKGVAVAVCGNQDVQGTLLTAWHLSVALPFLYDDPSSDTVFKPLLMNSFGGMKIGELLTFQSFVNCFQERQVLVDDCEHFSHYCELFSTQSLTLERGLRYLVRECVCVCVCLSVRLLPRFLRLCATRQ